MAPVTLSKIATVTVGASNAASISFTNIPQIYTDLKIVMSGRTTGAGESGQYISFNGSTSNFSGIYLYGDGTSTSSGTLARYAGTVAGTNRTASVFNNTEIYIPNYTSSNHKNYSVDNVAENNTTYGGQNFISGIWADVSPITSISIAPDNGSYPQYSTATLYGIKSLERSAYASGGEVTEIGGYYIHTFKGNGTFTPTVPLSVEYLVVAGGGGGGYNVNYQEGAGGGGGGGVLTGATSVSVQNYSVVVGGGGLGGTSASNGENSTFAGLTAIGGGRGGRAGDGINNGGANGGSGGGMAGFYGPTGSGTSGQGFAGGDSSSSGRGAGGGGAGGVGIGGATSGNGGVGILSSISGAATYYAGGGGGGGYYISPTAAGSGGLGGGASGANNNSSTSTPGTANTGGGGGGAGGGGSGTRTGSAGGSGIVIIRYRK